MAALTEDQLFRFEAINAHRPRWHGGIVMSTPLSFTFLSLAVVVLILAFVAFVGFATYTKRTTVQGQIIPSTGLVKLYAQQAGVVVEKQVTEGAVVRQGDVLFVISLERNSGTRGDTQAAISEQARVQLLELREQRGRSFQVTEVESKAYVQRIATIRQDLRHIEAARDTKRERLGIAQTILERNAQLQKDGYVTRDQLLNKQAELLDQRAELERLERDFLETRRLLQDAERELRLLPITHQSQLSELDGKIARVEQELTESESRRRLVVAATDSGVVTSIVAHVGQAVETNVPLASIVPSEATLQAHLYARSNAVGNIKAGDQVRLRYQAFPYQHFGLYTGRVATVSTSALSSSELTGYTNFDSQGVNEPLYRIAVDLDSQTVNFHGRQKPLQVGMLLEADILQDKRRIYEWILEPLYGLKRSL